MTKLTFSKKMKVITVAGGILLSAIFLCGFLFFLFTELRSVVTWAIMFPLFIVFAAVSVFGISEALFSYCSFDDENGIEFYSGFTKVKKIPVSSLQGFLVTERGISISYKTVINDGEKIKSLTVSAYFQNLQLLNEWLDSHTYNLYVEQVTQSVKEFTDSHCELSDDEKSRLFQKIHMVARILKWGGTIISVLFIAAIFLGRSFLYIGFIVCAAYPILLLLIMRFSNGEIRLNVKDTDVYPSLLSPFYFCSGALCLLAVVFTAQIYSLSKQLCVSAFVMLVMSFLYYICANESGKKTEEKHSTKILTVISVLFLMFLYGFGFSVCANIMFDKSKPAVFEVTVINQRVSKGKHTYYYLKVSPWIDGKTNQKEISVGSRLYAEVDPGDTVKIKLYKGFFDVPWFKTVNAK
ncbi:hypothetical protein [Treponema sp. Marseille-Q4523]|uniref:hypothetical protein n=1 Tax=Treponema sp. Marseille-Q4523 TaxID=2810610 RepID=UPI00195F29B9|nr:hypothetical protein [Treponema sp. Marseille-Q4523]MBM7024100.1 hypothetical protein [Treponema sp. Marseille-Q4523]